MKISIKRLGIPTMLLCLISLTVNAGTSKKNKENDPVAQEMFKKVFDMAFGPQGSTMTYKVNIIGIYKTEGTIFYKGKKRYFVDQKVQSWDNGITTYTYNKKKKVVDIWNSNDEKKEKHSGKFKANLNSFNYTYETHGDYYFITGRMKNPSLMGIKYVTLKVLKSNLYPTAITVKMAFIKTTVQISNFHAGNISDNIFIFPHDKYKGCKFVDHRKLKVES